jgi:hypothetical protein
MTKKICNKCGLTFKSAQGLVSHQNRTTPCDQVINLTCRMCNKIFKQKHHLERHLDRKTPCIKKNTSSLEGQKELINLQVESRIKILEKKKEIQKEVIELHYEKKKFIVMLNKKRQFKIKKKYT